MPDIASALLDIGQAITKDLALFGSSHLKAAIGYPGQAKSSAQGQQMPSAPEIRPFTPRPMPSLAPLPFSSTQEPQVARKPLDNIDVSPAIFPPSTATDKTGIVEDAGVVGESYAAEWEDLSIACAPCTRRHLSTIAEASKVGAATSNPQERRENFALAAGEALVWQEYDVTADKLAKANPRDRQAIGQAVHNIQPATQALPMAPRQVVLAWATVGEATRFARSRKPTDRDRVQVNLRMRDVDGMAGYLDSTYAADPAWQPHLDEIRKARHRWTREGYTPEALAQAETAFHAATVAFTPDLSDAEAQDVARKARSARDAFYKDMAQGAYRGAAEARVVPPVTQKPGAMVKAFRDIDTRLPQELASAYLQEVPETERELLGATPATETAFENLLRMQRGRTVPVEEENLPPVLQGGQVAGVIEGAYYPPEPVIWLSPAATSEAPHALFTLTHESAHSLLHSTACDIYPPTDDYANDPAEHEANAAAMLTLIDCGLPMETDTGRAIPPQTMRADLAAMERRLGKRGLQRVQWAAGILSQAIRGDVSQAAQASGACPR